MTTPRRIKIAEFARRHRTRLIVYSSLVGIVLFFVGPAGCYMTMMPGRSHFGPLPELNAEEREVRDQLERHVQMLAGSIGERNVFGLKYEQLRASEDYIRAQFQQSGYEVEEQEFQVLGRTARNLEVRLAGTTRADEIIVIGGHYDAVIDCPAANDNASGTAGVLEVARLLAGRRLARTVRFVAFVNEEPPFFQTDDMGSMVYAKRCRQRGENIVGMISLETIGYYSDVKGSQQYPPPFSLYYPNTGNFVAFVGNIDSRPLVRKSIRLFREHVAFPSEGVAAPGAISGIGWSDHWSFWQYGYPGLMVTDTAPFRYPHYHTAEDTPDKLDYERMARVVAGMARVVVELASDDE